MKKLFCMFALLLTLVLCAAPALASEVDGVQETTEEGSNENDLKIAKAISAAIIIGAAASAGAVAMTHAIAKGSEGIARQPEAAGDIRTNTMLGLVFIETAIIYALIVAILVIFVL